MKKRLFLNRFRMKKLLFICNIIIISSLTHIIGMDIYSHYKAQPYGIIYSPWREKYCNQVHNTSTFIPKSCPFCNIINNKNNTENLVLYRGEYSLIMLASQPYITNGIHLLIVPYQHAKEINQLSSETYAEQNILTHKLCNLFTSRANEIYVNANQGYAAGASVPEHYHRHIIINQAPRYYNLIHAMRETTNPVNLSELFEQLQPNFNELKTDTLIQKKIHHKSHLDCYYCTMLAEQNDKQNLIIYRGKYATAMLSHYPIYPGEIDIIPHDHIESLEQMPLEVYEEINTFAMNLYPLILKIVDAEDSNIGLISYGDKATHTEHIIQKLIPRKDKWKKNPITKNNILNANISEIYNKLLLAFQNQNIKNLTFNNIFQVRSL